MYNYDNYDVLDIKTWKNKFTSNECNFDKIEEYLNFIKEAINKYDPSRYSEKHHIMPRCLDKEHKYDKQICRINGTDHCRAHMILVDCFNGHNKFLLGCAIIRMTRDNLNDLDPNEYELARKTFSLSQSGSSNPSCQAPSPCRHKIWITDGIYNKRIDIDKEIPNNWRPGITKSKDISLIRITDGIHNTTVSKISEIPSGWKRGVTLKNIIRIGERNGMYGKFWITDGKVNRVVQNDSDIPDGWMKGMTSNLPDQHGTNSKLYGKVSITNGIISKLVSVDDPIPEGWKYGQKQDHSKYGCNFNQGRIYINNGYKNKMIMNTEEIPQGWKRGMIRKRRDSNG